MCSGYIKFWFVSLINSYNIHAREIGSCFSFNRPNIEIIDETPEGEQFDYFRPEGIITYTIDRMYDVLEVETNFNS